MSNDSKTHFDKIADKYDFWKRKNFYYYENLKKFLKILIFPDSNVMDIGCATGDILASLEPSRGFGIDISPTMIRIAELKYGGGNIKFEVLDIMAINYMLDYDYVILVDVIEHISDLAAFMVHISEIVNEKAKIIIFVANPLWEPLLLLAERLKMKMPEGPHTRLSLAQNEEIFCKSGFRIIDKNYRLLIPKKILGSDWINSWFYKNKILAKLGFVTYWVLRRE